MAAAKAIVDDLQEKTGAEGLSSICDLKTCIQSAAGHLEEPCSKWQCQQDVQESSHISEPLEEMISGIVLKCMQELLPVRDLMGHKQPCGASTPLRRLDKNTRSSPCLQCALGSSSVPYRGKHRSMALPSPPTDSEGTTKSLMPGKQTVIKKSLRPMPANRAVLANGTPLSPSSTPPCLRSQYVMSEQLPRTTEPLWSPTLCVPLFCKVVTPCSPPPPPLLVTPLALIR